ncbi:uncharacterized protein [Elaeis guineensis]|uniref:Uncharacterized protein LOC105049032 isoform X2 n=1 Tax=Elaeis guineensis var. tenera TaxID=51953 RepID=A0A6I9RQS7_ELAGV|nr:uncharacterized protein LOC105049032 isoform X2 [Elaeis guineensis]
MASSVARMPTDDWRDPNRLAAGVFGAHAHHPFGNNLRKVLVREPDRDPVGVTSSTSTSSSTTMAVGGRDAVGPRKMTELSSAVGEDSGSLRTARKRESQILDRWAARQAREMVTTIERQAHQAEISALTTTTQPVSARAASFLRDSSPALSDTSAATAAVSAASTSSSIDLPPNVRASSLIQMWRELEAEAGITPTNRTTSGNSNSAFTSAAAAMAEEPSGGSDVCDDSEAFGDWDSDITITTAHSSMSESERGRVGSIVKMLSSANATRSSAAAAWIEDVEPLSRESPGVSDHGDSQNQSLRSTGAGLRRMRGRREMEDWLAKLEQGRRNELSAVAERQPVSRFLHRGRLQSMLRLRALRREVAVQDQLRTASTTLELDRLQSASIISFLRQRFNNRGQDDVSGVPVVESSSCVHNQFPIDTQGSEYPHSADQCTGDSNRYEVVISPRDLENLPPELNSPHSGSDDLQEGSHTLDGSWDDRSLWVSNLDWQRLVDSSPSHESQGDIITEEVESYAHQNIRSSDPMWITGPLNSWREWGVSRQATYHDLGGNFSDNEEIRDLLERRRVSTSLASDFCDKMNRLILSFLQRQAQQSFDDNYVEDYEEQTFWRQSDEFQNADQVASSSSSLIPMPYQTQHHLDRWQHTSFRHHSSQNFLEMETMNDLRSDMAQIHHEINELRKLVENCMEWQANLQHSIKQEVSHAVYQSHVGTCVPVSSVPMNCNGAVENVQSAGLELWMLFGHILIHKLDLDGTSLAVRSIFWLWHGFLKAH